MSIPLMPAFLYKADNVYRTEHYIVSQQIDIEDDGYDQKTITSVDTYYARNEKLDLMYETFYAERPNLDGRRVACQESIRFYVNS